MTRVSCYTCIKVAHWIIFIVMVTGFACIVFAHPGHHDVNKDDGLTEQSSTTLSQSAEYQAFTLHQANQIINTIRLLGSDKSQLNQLEDFLLSHPQASAEWLSMRARLAQYQHDFVAAEAFSLDAVTRNPNDISTQLLLTTIYNNLGEFDKAANVCLDLAGAIDHALVMACQLDAMFQKVPEQQKYTQLQAIVSAFVDHQHPQFDYIIEVLASMAVHLNDPEAALRHLGELELLDTPTSTIVLWADSQLALGRYQTLLTKLAPIAKQLPALDDAIMLRLAIAEKHSERVDSQYWQRLTDQRMQQRIADNHVDHGAVIAEYYLHLTDNPEQALTWAKANYKNAKALEDRRLLQRISLKIEGS